MTDDLFRYLFWRLFNLNACQIIPALENHCYRHLPPWKIIAIAIYRQYHQRQLSPVFIHTLLIIRKMHDKCLHGNQNLAMWRRELIKQQQPTISSTRDLVDKSLPCFLPSPPRTTGKTPQPRTAHFVIYIVTSPLCCVYVREMSNKYYIL